ncbi:hypothetical protein HYW74_04765 [Candidatus Pacearchaeota archaeon]|nr:hypothetical protein [Candidatus Pacearchaeota archaeon]
MNSPYQRLEKIANLLESMPASSWSFKNGRYDVFRDDIRFRLYVNLEKGEFVNAAEGGILVGEGENAEVITHLRVRRNTQRVVLEITDVAQKCLIEDYHEIGDLPDERFVRANGYEGLSILFSLYVKIAKKTDTYLEAISRSDHEKRVSLGKGKLDSLLGIK